MYITYDATGGTASFLVGGAGEPFLVFAARDEKDCRGSRISMWSDSAWPDRVRLFAYTITDGQCTCVDVRYTPNYGAVNNNQRYAVIHAYNGRLVWHIYISAGLVVWRVYSHATK